VPAATDFRDVSGIPLADIETLPEQMALRAWIAATDGSEADANEMCIAMTAPKSFSYNCWGCIVLLRNS